MNKYTAPRRCLAVTTRRYGGAEAPPSWEQIRGAGWQAHYYHNSTSGWFPALSNTTYETELGKKSLFYFTIDLMTDCEIKQ